MEMQKEVKRRTFERISAEYYRVCPYCGDEMYESRGLLICRDLINCGFTVKKERKNEG
jgi:hypothetical protein